MVVIAGGCNKGGGLTGDKRRLRALPGAAEPHAGPEIGGQPEKRTAPGTPPRRGRRRPVPSDQMVASAENATSSAAQRRTARPRAITAKGGRVPPLAAVREGKRLGVRPAAFVPGSKQRRAQARQALAVLYRDFLACGGLDFLHDRRSHARPANDAQEREAA